MIIVRLLGGLGNQMFQYAAGRALAARHGVSLKLDLSAFSAYPLRTYRLHQFCIEAELAEGSEVARATGRHLRGLRRRLHGAIEGRRPYHRRRVIRERHFHHDPDLARVGPDAYLIGFWQSEKYFAGIRDLLLQELAVREPPDAANLRMLERIEAVDSISLHIRRGDYVTEERNQRLYGSCSMSYYESALEVVGSAIDEPHVFVFSDDIPWARAHLRAPYPVTFVDHNGEQRDHDDMRLMSRCAHHITANSSFSWWGAWLGTHPAKKVVAPSRWFDDPKIDTSDVVPDSWLRL